MEEPRTSGGSKSIFRYFFNTIFDNNGFYKNMVQKYSIMLVRCKMQLNVLDKSQNPCKVGLFIFK